jgi:hypothetical protein
MTVDHEIKRDLGKTSSEGVDAIHFSRLKMRDESERNGISGGRARCTGKDMHVVFCDKL